MADNRHFHDPDIREALHTKYDSEALPCLTDDFMDKVIARTDQCRHTQTSQFRKTITAAIGIAASIIITGVAVITILNYKADEYSSRNLSAISPQNCESAFIDCEAGTDAVTASGISDKDKQPPSTEGSGSPAAYTVPSKHSSRNKVFGKPTSATDSKEEKVTNFPDKGDTEYYTQETRQMLSARFDRGKDQNGELREIIENNQRNDINK